MRTEREKQLREYLEELNRQLRKSSKAEEIIYLIDEIEKIERELGLTE
ncbi:MAG: hypothetical protein QXQ63_04335 [Candidatus Bathyarchaeia archaeon]